MKNTFKTSKALVTVVLLLALAEWLLPTSSLEAQTAAPGWTLNVHATNVSTVSGGEALAADLATGALFVKSLQDPAGSPVQVVRVPPSGTVTVLAPLSSLQNSDISGITIDPLTRKIIVADELGGSGGRIALINLSTLTVSTLFDVPWVMNPLGNGTGQQQYTPDPGNPSILYFWDSTLSKLFRLDRSTNALLELVALDQTTPVGQHLTTFTNDVVFDPATGRLLLTDGSSNSILEVDPSTSPPTVATLFSGIFPTPHAIALNPATNEVFIEAGFNAIFVGPRAGGSLSSVASGFAFLTDITVGNATAGSGLSLFAVDKTQDTVYEITPSVVAVQEVEIDIKPGSFPNSINPRSKGAIPVAILTTNSFDAATVDPLSVAFGPNGAVEAHGRGHIEDANGDGNLDLVLHFRTQDTGIQCGDTSASLTGETFSGQEIQGSDLIKTVGCK